MTVLDASGAIDYLLGWSAAERVEQLLSAERRLIAPDILVYEVISALRRQALRGQLVESRARAALSDLGEMRLQLFPSLILRKRAWQLRDNLTVADALYVALAEQSREPLASKDGALLAAVASLDGVAVSVLPL